ncbi:MAG: crossover junction endodeoxyribonuclease RuvC [Bacteroidota bacterium]|jgi:crossover junction endodeoxyribonuclease RuvC
MNSTAINKETIILGIDPGTVIMGYALVLVKAKKPSLLVSGVLKLNKLEDQTLRLKKIFERTISLIDEFHPDELAIEAPFFGKNVQSMLKLGRAQGVAIAAALSRQLPVFEYSPRKIKQSVTGNGNASKEQLAAMIGNHIELKETLEYLDASDALGVALCHHFQNNPAKKNKSYSGWEAFINANPGRKA